VKGEKNSNGYGKEFKIPEDVMMSWPKLNDQWKTLFILRQTSKGSRRWQKPQKRKKTLTPSD